MEDSVNITLSSDELFQIRIALGVKINSLLAEANKEGQPEDLATMVLVNRYQKTQDRLRKIHEANILAQ